MAEQKINLLDLDHAGLAALFVELGEKPFRATQIMKWIYQFGVSNFDDMNNLSKVLREKLSNVAEIRAPDIIHEHISADGTIKWLLNVGATNAIETVYIPEDGRGTLCVSSQIGCALECTFCSTAQQGFNRNLSTAEIIGQVWQANRALQCIPREDRKITNIVMMGMGEPLLNFNNLVPALNLMVDDNAYGLSKRRVTVSTSGVVPALDRLKEVSDVALALSLHAPTDELRNTIVPINQKYPLKDLIAACNRYIAGETKRKVTVEYVMLNKVNDSIEQAKQTVKLLSELPSKVNLIPFNPFPDTDYQGSTPERTEAFRNVLVKAGIITTIRKTRGDDIAAACGQLAGQVEDKSKRTARLNNKTSSQRVVVQALNSNKSGTRKTA